jgi:catechol 2,3-dioxygenase
MNNAGSAGSTTSGDFFRPRRLGHANLFVRDYERAAEFYRDVVGFREVYRQPDNMASFVSNGNTYHDLALTDLRSRYAANLTHPGLWHLAYELETEVDLVDGYNRAVAAGVKFAFMQDHDVAHSLYQHDPDGNLVEIYADVISDWRAHRHGVITKKKPDYIPGVTSPANPDRNYPQNPTLDVVEEAVFHPRKIGHVAMVARNFEAMFRFHTHIVGLSPLVGDEQSAFAVLRGTVGTGDLTLYRQRPGLEPGLHHVGFEVWDEADLDRSLTALARANLVPEREIGHRTRRAVCIKDPDDLLLQFYVNRNWSAQAIQGMSDEEALYLL